MAWVAPAPVRIFLPGVYYPEIWGLLPKPGNLGSFLIILFCFSDVIYLFFLQKLLKLENHRWHFGFRYLRSQLFTFCSFCLLRKVPKEAWQQRAREKGRNRLPFTEMGSLREGTG